DRGVRERAVAPDPRRVAQRGAVRRACARPARNRPLDRPDRRGGRRSRSHARPRGSHVPARRRPCHGRPECGGRRPAGRRRPALAGACELRPVSQLREARRHVSPAGGGAALKRQSVECRLLTLVPLGLVALGLVMVYSATSAPAALARTDPMSYLKKQGAYAFLGVFLMMAAAR